MRRYGRCARQRAFTLVELLAVLAIIGLLASMALVRYAQLSDAAHRAGVRATGAAYGSGVVLVHAQWLVNGSGGAVSDVSGFGAGDVDVNTGGWPVDTAGATDSAMTVTRCSRLWGALLHGDAPSVAPTAGAGVEYVVSAPSSHRCRYAYQQDLGGRQIEYDVASGTVVTTSPPASARDQLPWPMPW